MKTSRIVAVLFEISLFALVVWTYQFSTLLGIAATVLWLGFAAGLSVMFLEPNDDQHKPLRTSTSDHDPLKELVGSKAKTVSALRPQGTVEIQGKQYQAKALSGFIEANRMVFVTSSENRYLIVTDNTS